jgi:NADPH:quinone reductase-like Zn-dependent oxidoreductase
VVESGDPAWVGKEVVINPSLGWGESERFQDPKGFRILGLPDDGTFAEQVVVPVENLVEKPGHLSHREAAALPLAGLTAYRALVARAELRPGERVLVTGAGGGTAVFALQFAVALGGLVFVTSGSDEKIEAAKKLGALGGVNYKSETWDADLKGLAGGFDVIVDSAGGPGLLKAIDLANPGARVVFFGATTGDPPSLPMRKVFWKQISLLGTTMGSPVDFRAMVDLVNRVKLRPVVSEVFPLERTNDALDHMAAHAQMGKIVIDVVPVP